MKWLHLRRGQGKTARLLAWAQEITPTEARIIIVAHAHAQLKVQQLIREQHLPISMWQVMTWREFSQSRGHYVGARPGKIVLAVDDADLILEQLMGGVYRIELATTTEPEA